MEDKMSNFTKLMAIACMVFGFASITVNPAQARGDFYDVMHCEDKRNYDRETHRCEGEPTRSSDNITDIEPLTETAQGGDRDGDVGGGDFGGDADRAAASTAAE